MNLILSILVAVSAQAATPPASTGNFQFVIEPAQTGCVHLTYATLARDFPKGKLATVRFYYGSGEATSVNQQSPYFTSTVKTDSSGEMSLTPIKFCGLSAGHFSFKYGLASASGDVFEFMPDSDFNPDTNSTDVH